MYTNPFSHSNLSGVAGTSARIGPNHGYRFEGDRVFLNASFESAADGTRDRNWELQLSACRVRPESVDDVARGHCIASGVLPPISEISDACETFGVWADAQPPAGTGSWVMVIALAERTRVGAAGADVRHFEVFPQLEQFQQPRLGNMSGFRVIENGGAVTIWTDSIENPRGTLDLSGTLSLELWALPAAYERGNFSGTPLAGIALGSLPGGQSWQKVEYTLPFHAPVAGTWNLVLMLREWTGAGYTSRDFVNFAVPYVVEETRPVIVEVERREAERVVALSTPASAPAPATAAKPADAAGETLSLNTATVAALKAIKGMTDAVARAIVQARPFTSIDELRKVKGVGARTFEKLRGRLRLD